VEIRSGVAQTVEQTIQKRQLFASDAGSRFLGHVRLVEQHYLMAQNTVPTAEKRSDYVLQKKYCGDSFDIHAYSFGSIVCMCAETLF
jgi:hypothetical protein